MISLVLQCPLIVPKEICSRIKSNRMQSREWQ